MALSEFDGRGDLPEGLHRATLAEVIARFGRGTEERARVTAVLERIYRLAAASGKLDRFIIFGSYVTNKSRPRDVDVVLVMKDDFALSACDEETSALFDHQRAEAEFGASVFWLVPSALLASSLDDFILGWGTKRDLSRRGIIEVVS